jgi:hypothetical protein
VALVEEVLVGDLLERPPDRVDVRAVERAVRVVEVDPEADALGQRVPVLEEGEDRLAALLVELGDAVVLDLGLVLDAQLLLDGDLHRQAVAVPAALALDQVALHRLVARVDVLEDAGEDVVGPRPAVRGRRALVEDPRLAALTVADRLAEHVALAPAAEDLLLEVGEGLLGVDGAVRHGLKQSMAVRSSSRLVPAKPAGHPSPMHTAGLEVRTLAMSLDLARSGIESARIQQQQPGNPAEPAATQTADVILDLSAAAQALIDG